MGTSNEADKVLRKVTMALLYGSLKSGVATSMFKCEPLQHILDSVMGLDTTAPQM